MTTALHGWLNRAVRITLHAPAPAAIHGTLLHVDDAGITLERAANKLFVPFAAILHVESCEVASPEQTAPAAGQAEIPHECFWRPHA